MVRRLSRLAFSVSASAVVVAAGTARAGDAGHGRTVFASQCSTCHSSTPGRVVVGPPLFGVIGRRAGSVPSFAYSKTMSAAGFVWTPDRLRAYLPAPKQYLPGVKMAYQGLKNPGQLDDLIAYLETLK